MRESKATLSKALLFSMIVLAGAGLTSGHASSRSLPHRAADTSLAADLSQPVPVPPMGIPLVAPAGAEILLLVR